MCEWTTNDDDDEHDDDEHDNECLFEIRLPISDKMSLCESEMYCKLKLLS